jgi:quercetin dioxygenase-like cupin family protein
MTVDNIKLGETQTLRVVRSSTEALELESTWQPGGGTPPHTHWHPHQHEHFEVLVGELTVRLGGEASRVLAAGEAIEVPPRTAHSMWNAGTAPCSATWRVTPARRTEEMFRTIDAGLGPLDKVRLLWTFRHEFRLGSPRGG